MLEIIKIALSDKSGALTIIISVMILAIGGSHKLLSERLDDEHRDIKGLEIRIHSVSERLHVQDKRIIVLETKANDD